MKYLQSTGFSVGGHSKAYADNFDRIFGKKNEERPKESTVPSASPRGDGTASFGQQAEALLRALTAAVPPKAGCNHALLLRRDGLPGLLLQLSGGWFFNIDPDDFRMGAEALAKVVVELRCPICGAFHGEPCTRGER